MARESPRGAGAPRGLVWATLGLSLDYFNMTIFPVLAKDPASIRKR
jgi:hypothetical protein